MYSLGACCKLRWRQVLGLGPQLLYARFSLCLLSLLVLEVRGVLLEEHLVSMVQVTSKNPVDTTYQYLAHFIHYALYVFFVYASHACLGVGEDRFKV